MAPRGPIREPQSIELSCMCVGKREKASTDRHLARD
jgi:hypothetical protein